MQFDNDKANKSEKRSPLFTSLADKRLKATIISEHGKDKDGAYRAYNRLDKQKAS